MIVEIIWEYIQNHAPTIATIFFFLFFCHVVYTLFKKGQEQKYDDFAKIPFKEKDLKKSGDLKEKNSKEKESKSKQPRKTNKIKTPASKALKPKNQIKANNN